MIKQQDLIASKKDDNKIIHLAKAPLTKLRNVKYPNLYAWGYNTGGRPEGFWVSYGYKWLKFVDQLKSDKFPACCYLYEVVFKPSAKIIEIETDDDFIKFDRNTPNYWLNMDYYSIDIYDYMTDTKIQTKGKYDLKYDHLKKSPKDSLQKILLTNKIIFDNAADALKYCQFYKETAIPIERFKFKDWAVISAKIDGILFKNFDKANTYLMFYLWYQTLDSPSGCIWKSSAIKTINIKYIKEDNNKWIRSKTK